VDKFEILEVADDVPMEFSFDDPYKIDDDFISFAFSNKAFDSSSMVAAIKRVHGIALKLDVSKNSKVRLCCPTKKIEPEPVTVNGVNFNPFQERIVLAIAAIFWESVESYRAIVSSTGLEGFCDMLIVNGSLNLSKWKIIGTIDQIMDEFHSNKSSRNEGPGNPNPGHSRIPAFLSKDATNSKKNITCRKSDIEGRLKQTQHSSSGIADCSLHGPASSSQDFIQAAASNDGFLKTLKMIPEANGFFAKAEAWFSDAKHRYEENIEWDPFQPGCSFEIDLNSKLMEQTGGESNTTAMVAELQQSTKHSSADVRFTVVDKPKRKLVRNIRFTVVDQPKRKLFTNTSDNSATIELVDDNEKVVAESPKNEKVVAESPNCHLHLQCFQALELKVEKMCADEFEFSNPSSTMYSHQLLHAYRPRGALNSSLSCLFHSCFCVCAVCPTLFFFVFWAYNNVNLYLIHPYWTPAAYVIIYTIVFAGICVAYLLVVYLDFPLVFYGKSLISQDINYFWFKPFIGLW
jgi:hypothetical protein